jgi:hypothetical protein
MKMSMIRKQLYLEERQHRALKRRAEELGVSEAEVMRRALDDALRDVQTRSWRPGRAQAGQRLVTTWRRRAWRLETEFDREEVYGQRLERLANGPAEPR